MEERCIRKARKSPERLFGPDFPGRETRRKQAAREYAEAVSTANDGERIHRIGKKHLQLVESMLDGKQFSLFLTHGFKLERFL